jgi:DNA polymerase elongation subunit (family B)
MIIASTLHQIRENREKKYNKKKRWHTRKQEQNIADKRENEELTAP